MRRQQTMMPLPLIEPLAPGTTLDDVADWLRYVVGRHQALRTRLRLRPDEPPQQVLHGSGEMAIDLVEAGGEDPFEVAQRQLEWRDRYIEVDYDVEREWPLFVAVILKDDVPVCQLVTICHLVMDASGGVALGADLAGRKPGGAAAPITATQPLEQATWQQSPEGQRLNRITLRRWEGALRQLPARRFPVPVDRGEPRHWRLHFASPAAHLAIQIIRDRTGASAAHVILTMFLIALARVTGVNPSATRVAVNNRFRRGLAGSVSIVTQYSLCAVDVADVTFDEALARLRRRVLGTLKDAYYDPLRLDELAERIGRDRGEEMDIQCYYNDRRLSDDPGLPPDTVPEPVQVRAALALTTLTNEPLSRGSERLFAAVEDEPGTYHLLLEADTHHLSQEAMAACARATERVVVDAALNPTALTGVATQPTVAPVGRP